MSRRSARRSRRPFVQWRGAIPLALVTAVLGYVAVTDSLAQALRKKAPARAYALAPSDGRSTAALYGIFGPGNVLPVDGSAHTVGVGMRHVF